MRHSTSFLAKQYYTIFKAALDCTLIDPTVSACSSAASNRHRKAVPSHQTLLDPIHTHRTFVNASCTELNLNCSTYSQWLADCLSPTDWKRESGASVCMCVCVRCTNKDNLTALHLNITHVGCTVSAAQRVLHAAAIVCHHFVARTHTHTRHTKTNEKSK